MELTDATLYETVDVVGAFLQVSSRPGDEEPEFIGNLPNKTEKCYVPPWRKVGLWWLPRIFPSPPLLLQLLIRKLRLAGDWLAHFVCVSMTRWNVWTFFKKKKKLFNFPLRFDSRFLVKNRQKIEWMNMNNSATEQTLNIHHRRLSASL